MAFFGILFLKLNVIFISSTSTYSQLAQYSQLAYKVLTNTVMTLYHDYEKNLTTKLTK